MGLRHLFLFLVLFVLALNGAFLYLIIYGITTPRVILVEGLILLTFFSCSIFIDGRSDRSTRSVTVWIC